MPYLCHTSTYQFFELYHQLNRIQLKIINIDTRLSVPKYKQIVLSIERAIAEKRLKRNDKLPSVNKVSLEFNLSRDTVLVAYDELKKRGIIYAILGKGYYVKSVEFSFEQRIFLLFDELNSFKEDLYNSFLATMNSQAQIDIFFHHFNIEMFRKLINESNGNYSKYVIMPTNLKGAASIIKTLPENDVYILDQTNEELASYPAVYQNFVADIYNAFAQKKKWLEKYNKLILIFPGFREPEGMKIGFEKFCVDFQFKYEIFASFSVHDIQKNELYVVPNDRDLVHIIEQAQRQNLKIGVDFGIISYNETPLKKVVAQGITTISTDFEAMGKSMGKMILENAKKQIENPCTLTIRNSL